MKKLIAIIVLMSGVAFGQATNQKVSLTLRKSDAKELFLILKQFNSQEDTATIEAVGKYEVLEKKFRTELRKNTQNITITDLPVEVVERFIEMNLNDVLYMFPEMRRKRNVFVRIIKEMQKADPTLSFLEKNMYLNNERQKIIQEVNKQ